MIIKKVKLNNIRSYKDQEIEFPEGSILLSGDIGSGKTSVLLGIEFAFFGLQPGQRGSSILRNGEIKGGVSIEFEVDGKEILIERTLKRGKTVSQDYCAITIEGEKQEISVTELKNKVLELLNYPKEFSKKLNTLYKFTVYTPQEEMKQIILQDPETRTNILRHVFGIDKYKKIIENTSILSSKIREEKRIKQGITMNLEQDKANIILKEDQLEEKRQEVSIVEKELFIKIDNRKEIQKEKQEISGKIEEKIRLQQEIENTNLMLLTKNDSFSNNKRLIEKLQEQINELGDLTFNESKIKEIEEEIIFKQNEKQRINEDNIKISSQINSLDIKNKENELIKSKISHLEICPTCLQDVEPVYKTNVVNKMDSDVTGNIKKIQMLNLEKRKLSEKLNKLNYEISISEKEIQDLKILKVKQEGIKEKQIRIEELKNTDFSLEKDIELLNKQIDILKDSVFELSRFDSVFESKQRELDEALKQERFHEIKVAELKKEIEMFYRQIQELKEKVKEIEEVKKQLDYLTNLENWLSKKFMPVISFIEKNVMVKLKTEFSKLFSEWFSMLVSDSFNVQLSDDFTPLVEYQDYEIDFAYLSGGERTAIALAYRLALNQVINSLLSKIKTKDIVILDEPTDGFSEQQLDKMRDVLQELNVKQLIIVSHEQKIESFVENVIRFKKESGISKIA